MDGFVQGNDFSGKTVIPFCTSSSSGIGESGRLLAEMAGTGDWLAAARTPLYLAIGDRDSYYGPASLEKAYADLHSLYERQGPDRQRHRPAAGAGRAGREDFFSSHGFSDQHAGGSISTAAGCLCP